MDTLFQDLRYGIRILLRNPAFALVAVLTLALGIGANTAIFSVVDAALLRGLRFEESARLVKIWMTKQGTFNQMEASYPNYLDWKAQTQIFESIGGYSGDGVLLKGPERDEPVDGSTVSASFFPTLRVQAALGRTFLPEEDTPQGPQTVVLTYGLWKQRFGGDPKIVGESITVDDEPHTVIGVLPAWFQFAPLGRAKLFRAAGRARSGGMITRRNLHWFNIVGRLKPGTTLDQARAEMETISAQLAKAYPESNAGTSTRVIPLAEDILGEVRPVFLALLAAVGFVLLIACVNVANLLLAKSAARQRELGVRIALGAPKSRVARQLLTESVLLALVGGAVGVVLAEWGVRALIAAIPEDVLSFMPYLQGLSVDPRALAFTAGVSVVTGLLFGMAPVLHLPARTPQQWLREGGERTSGARGGRTRDLLVASEMALALMLLIGAGLMIKSVVRMLQVDPGFDTHNLLTLRYYLPPGVTGDDDNRTFEVQRRIRESVAAIPGVSGVGEANLLPLGGGRNTVRMKFEGRAVESAGEQPEANIRGVSPEYFSVLGARLLHGRYFTEQDRPDGPRVVIINRTLARQIYGSSDVAGRRLAFTFAPNQPWREIVGVVDDVNEVSLDVPSRAAIYVPGSNTMSTLAIRTSSDPHGVRQAAQNAVLGVENQTVILNVSTMEENIGESTATFLRRYPALLSAVFAAMALLLAMVGIYGVLAYSVSQRTREIGVRMALGARRVDVSRLVMGKAMRLTVGGIAAGIVGAVVVAKLISSMLFGVSQVDPQTFLLAPLAVLGVALLAAYLPARRATRVEPMSALRYE